MHFTKSMKGNLTRPSSQTENRTGLVLSQPHGPAALWAPLSAAFPLLGSIVNLQRLHFSITTDKSM